MNTFELTGTLIEVFPAQTFGKGFRKREFVVEYGDKYPQKICLQLTKEKCEIIDAFEIGDQLTVSFNLTGRDWTDKSGQVKYFNTLEAWKIAGQKGSRKSSPEDDAEFDGAFDQGPASSGKAPSLDWSTDDLPF